MRVLQRHRVLFRCLVASVLVSVAPQLAAPLHAQFPMTNGSQHALVLQAGQWYADVDGMVVGAIRTERPLGHTGRWLFVPGVTYAHYALRSPVPEVDLLAPEALVHLQLARGWIRPYVGGGAGIVLLNMFHTVDPVLSLGAGLRADLTSQWGARLELETRAFGQFNAASVGWSFGLARHF